MAISLPKQRWSPQPPPGVRGQSPVQPYLVSLPVSRIVASSGVPTHQQLIVRPNLRDVNRTGRLAGRLDCVRFVQRWLHGDAGDQPPELPGGAGVRSRAPPERGNPTGVTVPGRRWRATAAPRSTASAPPHENTTPAGAQGPSRSTSESGSAGAAASGPTLSWSRRGQVSLSCPGSAGSPRPRRTVRGCAPAPDAGCTSCGGVPTGWRLLGRVVRSGTRIWRLRGMVCSARTAWYRVAPDHAGPHR